MKLIDHTGDCGLYDTCTGHCFPTEQSALCDASQQYMWVGTVAANHRCCVDGWSHGEEVVKFFRANTCDGTRTYTCAPTLTTTTTTVFDSEAAGRVGGRAGFGGAVLTTVATIAVCAY